MREIAIVGAGELGGAVAHGLARADVARSLVIVDERASVAAGKALDIAQAAPVEGFATQLKGAADASAAAGAEMVIVADRFGGREWDGDDAFALLRRLRQMAAGAIVVCAGASHRELVERAVRDVKFDRARVVGSAPGAVEGGAKALVALALNGSALDVSLSVLGVPPSQTVVAWDDATAGGFALMRQLDEPARRRLEARIAAMWPPGPFALAAAAVSVAALVAGRSRRLATCFVAPDVSQGERTRTAARPVRLGPAGIVSVVMPRLSVVEQVAWENAVML
jgi:malate dehydrogenase